MNVFIEIILVYLLYRFIAGFLVPLFRTTSTMRQQFRDMNGGTPSGNSSAQPRNAQTRPEEPSHTPKSGTGKAGEYIDFEEIK